MGGGRGVRTRVWPPLAAECQQVWIFQGFLNDVVEFCTARPVSYTVGESTESERLF